MRASAAPHTREWIARSKSACGSDPISARWRPTASSPSSTEAGEAVERLHSSTQSWITSLSRMHRGFGSNARRSLGA